MLHIRTVKTSSGATAVQIVRYVKRKRQIVSHIGSAKNETELDSLKRIAFDQIHYSSNQLSLLPLLENDKNCEEFFKQTRNSDFYYDRLEYRGFRYQLLYETLSYLIAQFEFNDLQESIILNDLVIARIAFPASKLESLEFISDYFGIKHNRATLYRKLSNKEIVTNWKDLAEAKIITIAKKQFNFNFSLVFYDLTTLYFESQKDEEGKGVRKIGFSKDNKASNPQIMIGLIVNDLGFPISYQLFPGNKFEGHTLLPVIATLRKKHNIKNMTIVADSAMISDENIQLLKNADLNYIVAARTANLPSLLIKEISTKLNQQDEATIRINTANKGDLILSFTKKRYDKEKREMDKQLEKANYYLKHPSAAEIIKRTKFLKNNKPGYELNQSLIDKATMLLGIKGYYTNLKEDQFNNDEIIKHYKNLWHVEQNFRISKSDLKARPIFHSKTQAIEAHMLICFMALAISKYIEIKTNKSIKSVIKLLKKISDGILYDPIGKREIVKRSNIDGEIKRILGKIRN